VKPILSIYSIYDESKKTITNNCNKSQKYDEEERNETIGNKSRLRNEKRHISNQKTNRVGGKWRR
jgi:hypothetical protein